MRSLLICFTLLVTWVQGAFIKWDEYVVPLAGAFEYQIMFVSDGSAYYTGVTNGDIYYYTFNQTGSHHVGTISVVTTAPKFSVSDDGTKIILGYLRDFYIFERVDVTFNQLLHYTCSDDIFRAALASDGSYAYIGYTTGTVIVFDTSTQTVIQTLVGISGAGSCRTITPNQDGSLLVVSYYAGKIKIYEMIGGLYYAYGSVYDIPNSPRPKSINVAARDFSLFFLGTLEFEIYILQRNGSQFQLLDVFAGALGHIDSFDVDEEANYFICEENVSQLHAYNLDQNMSLVSNTLFLDETNKNDIIIDKHGKYLITVNSTVTNVYLNCGDDCLNCDFHSCLQCVPELQLSEGSCGPPCDNCTLETPCVNDVEKSSGICKQYCAQQCLTCSNSPARCRKCAKHYVMDEKNETCVVENYFLKIVIYVRPYLNICRRNWFSPFFLVLEQLWLYNYHAYPYQGRIDDVFSTIRLIEDKKWALEPFHHLLLTKQYVHEQLPNYNQFSNPRFLEKEKHDESFLKVTIQYFAYYLPFMLIVCLILNKIFYLLFNFPVSIYFRIYSFWAILWMLSFEGNIQVFVFALLRSILLGFSSDFLSKIVLACSVLFGLFLTIYAVGIYFIYKYLYQNLSKYFLNNVYRLQASFVYMTIIYGIRPLLRGAAHSLLYYERNLQLCMLGGIQLLTVLTIIIFQFYYEIHVCKMGMFWKLCYHLAFIFLNLFLICEINFELEFIRIVVNNLIYLMISFCLLDSITLLLAGICTSSSSQQQVDDQLDQQQKKSNKDSNSFLLKQIYSPQTVEKPVLVVQVNKKKEVKITVKQLVLEAIEEESRSIDRDIVQTPKKIGKINTYKK